MLGITITAIPYFGNPNLDIPYIHIPFLEGEDKQPKIKKVEKKPTTQISRQITSRNKTGDLSFPMLMDYLKEFRYSSDKLEFIETKIDSMPNRFSWTELNEILDLFGYSDDKLKIAKLLQSRLESHYSDQDRKRFMNHFRFSDDKKEAINILLGK